MFDMEEKIEDCRLEQYTNNRSMSDKIKARIRTHVERMAICYGRTASKTIDAYTFELLKKNYSPREVSHGVEELLGGGYDSFPTLPEVRKVLASKYNQGKKLKHEAVNKEVLKDRSDYQKLRKSFLEKFTLEELKAWTGYYCQRVFGKEVFALGFVSSFEQIALKDLMRSNMNKEKAIEIGLKEIGR